MSGFCPNGTMCAPEDMNCIHPNCRENPRAQHNRPRSSNSDEWQLWLEENEPMSRAYLAVQISEAIEEHQRALAREVYGLAEATDEECDKLAEGPDAYRLLTHERGFVRGRRHEAKSIARAIMAIMPFSVQALPIPEDKPCDSPSGGAGSAAARIAALISQPTASPVETAALADLIATLKTMRDRDDRNGSLPIWYREQIDAALAMIETQQ